MTKLLVLDKDGTLVRPKSGNTFVQHPEDQEVIEGVAEAIARYIADGWTLAIASNQSGVAAGYKSLNDAIAEMQYCLKLLPLPAATEAYFCPDAGDTCWVVEKGFSTKLDYERPKKSYAGLYRKPNAGMLLRICDRENYTSDWRDIFEQKLMVGDRPEDEQAAQAAGFDFMWAEDWQKNN